MSRTFTVGMAKLRVEITCLFDATYGRCRDYLTDGLPDFRVEITQEDIDGEKRRAETQLKSAGKELPVFLPEELEWICLYRKIGEQLPAFDALIFHGAAVAVEGKAYVFTAPPGTGKSTHIALWKKNIPGCTVINGDKPILRLMDGVLWVCGTPWAGKEGWQKAENVPLGAVCLLCRGTENKIEEMPFASMLPHLLSQSYRPQRPEALRSTLWVLEKAGMRAGLYRLFCNMDSSAALAAYEGMRK